MLPLLPAKCTLPVLHEHSSFQSGAAIPACAALQVMEEIVQRTASAMVDRGTPFSGVLFAGLMIKDGKVRSGLLASQHTAGKDTSSPADPAQFGEIFMASPPIRLRSLGIVSPSTTTEGAALKRAAHVQARLLEHNVRFGDPECQCLMMRLQSDLLEALLAVADGRLGSAQLRWSPQKALTVRRLTLHA